MDALLGALGLGDIGRYFPPEDPRWKGADSLELLERVMELIRERGWDVVNVDAVVVAEQPSFGPTSRRCRQPSPAGSGWSPIGWG